MGGFDMALIARLLSAAKAALGGEAPAESVIGNEEHLAAVALLVHVARADGVLEASESERLVRLVRSRYGVSETEAQALIARADAFDAQTRDLSSLVSMIDEGSATERERILAMAWAVANADGELHEFEEALVWRLGKLLGFDEAGIARARQSEPLIVEPDAPAA